MSKGGIPETITLADGTVIKVAENPAVQEAITKAMQDARKEEKDKLYSTISTLEAQKTVLEGDKKKFGELTETQKKELEKVEAELKTLREEKTALEKKDDKKPEGKEKPAGEAGLTKADILEMLEGFSAKQAKAFEEKLEGLSGKLSTKTVSDYREKALAKYKGVIIEDFVPENIATEEEVDKAVLSAVEKSKKFIINEYDVDGKKKKMTIAEYEKYAEDNKEPEGGAGGKTPTYTGKETPPKPDQGGGGDLTGKDLLSKINDMTDEEYAKNHDQILKEAKSFTYTGGGE